MTEPQDNAALVERVVHETLGAGNFTVADELIAPQARFYTGARPEPFIGPAGFKEYIGRVRAGLPDARVEMHDLVADGDTVVAHWTLHGTHTDTLEGLPATNRTVAIEALELVRLGDGKLIEI